MNARYNKLDEQDATGNSEEAGDDAGLTPTEFLG